MERDARDNVQEGYDCLAATYAERIAGELAQKPFDRALLERFAALVGDGEVVDAGCGPGHVARFLHELGVRVTGLDLSAGMVEQAAALHPEIEFRQGSMTRLPDDANLAGIVALYSIIHIPRVEQPAMFANWRTSLRPGGYLLVAFHIGDADRHIEELWGHKISIDFLFFTREEIETRLRDAGFAIAESHERDPYPGVEAETRRGYIQARTSHS
jgi:SAM-dependent methyltransferase